MGHSTPTSVVSACPPIATTTSMASLSAPAHSGLPSTPNILSVPKLPAHRPPYKMWVICHCTPAPISSPIHSEWSSEEDWEWHQTEGERERICEIIRMEDKRRERKGRKKKDPYRTEHVCLTYLMRRQIYPSPTLQPQPKKRKERHKRNKNV